MHILKKTQENFKILGKLSKIFNLSKRTSVVPWHYEIEVTKVKKAKCLLNNKTYSNLRLAAARL